MGASKEFPITDHPYTSCGCGDPECPYCGECREQECFHGAEDAMTPETPYTCPKCFQHFAALFLFLKHAREQHGDRRI